MPSRQRNGGRAKHNKAITTRLIEISLKLDDYVYKEKPISAADAKDYISEISIYKTQCLQDERSLQVIEKLTRCMKAIVNEEQIDDCYEIQQVGGNETTAYSCLSPTYSLVEDIELATNNVQSQETQDIVPTNANGATSEKVTIDTTDLTTAEENKQEHIVFNIDVEMRRTISNLSIREQDSLKNTDVYSQSILDNFEQDSSKQKNLVSCLDVEDHDRQVTERSQTAIYPEFSLAACTTGTAIPIYKDCSVPDPIATKHNNNEITFIRNENSTQNNPNLIELTDVCKKKEVSVKKVVRFETKINNKANDNTVAKEHDRNGPKNATQKRNNSSKSKLNRQNNVQTKKRSKKEPNKQIKIYKQNNKILEDTSSKTPETNAKLKRPNTNSIVSTKANLSFTAINTLNGTNSCNTVSINNNVNKAKKYPFTKIYSNHTENDLSWVENIRFVREIQKEEVDNKLSSLNDSFWEDLSFPDDWDEREFNV